MTMLAAIIACILLAALAVFQAALAAGAPAGHFAWGGQHRVLPRHLRIGSAVAILIYALFAAILLQRAGLVTLLPAPVVDIGIWVQLAYLALGIPMNAISRSRPERFTMTPIVIVLFLLALTVAMGW
ncbi:MAG: hypothetical protein EOP22_06765 [Hyphomicrobiales bacterium]|nr:MAG: hypothetical protein EOP22_06765 [Hyphomicrobiales bacterium]